MITPEVLKEVGEALYGSVWQTELSNALKLSSPRRMRAWLKGERPIPQDIKGELISLLEENSLLTSNVALKLKTQIT